MEVGFEGRIRGDGEEEIASGMVGVKRIWYIWKFILEVLKFVN